MTGSTAFAAAAALSSSRSMLPGMRRSVIRRSYWVSPSRWMASSAVLATSHRNPSRRSNTAIELRNVSSSSASSKRGGGVMLSWPYRSRVRPTRQFWWHELVTHKIPHVPLRAPCGRPRGRGTSAVLVMRGRARTPGGVLAPSRAHPNSPASATHRAAGSPAPPPGVLAHPGGFASSQRVELLAVAYRAARVRERRGLQLGGHEGFVGHGSGVAEAEAARRDESEARVVLGMAEHDDRVDALLANPRQTFLDEPGADGTSLVFA